MILLCGTDFSPNSTEASNVAAELARRFGDSLTLVHADPSPVDDGVAPPGGSPDAASHAIQLELQATPLRAAGLQVETRRETGSPEHALRHLAEPGRCRMIVLSSIGRVALTRILLGSTADRIAESAPVPTLIVRRGIAFAEWREGRRPLRILVATDFSDASDAALHFAATWSQAGPIEMIVGHVLDPDREMKRRGMDPDAESVRTGLQSAVERDLHERVDLFTRGIPYSLVVECSVQSPASVLIELAKERQVDLVVTGSHQVAGIRRLWHQSTSRALLSDAPINVAVVPCDGPETAERIPPLNRVLATTDLSALANRAVPAACALLPPGGILRILHILPGTAATTDDEAARIRQLRGELAGMVPVEAASRGISVQCEVVAADDVAEAVLRDAHRFGAHALCLSSHGRGAAGRLLMGSVAQRILEKSDLPVHVVLPSRD